MAEKSKIEWCDATFNPWIGCSKVSPGCEHCYAETLMDTRYGRVRWGKRQPRSRTSEANWKLPLRWNHDAAENIARITNFHELPAGVIKRPRVFCASLADWLDDEVPAEWLVDLLALIRATPQLDWLLLTKRPQNWRARLTAAFDSLADRRDMPLAAWIAVWLGGGGVPENIWIGTTVEDQTRADERIPELLKIPARVRFLSCEPLLGPVNLVQAEALFTDLNGRIALNPPNSTGFFALINWVICGGESGPGARPMHPAWSRSLRDQCAAAGVPFLFKQFGEWLPLDQVIHRLGAEWTATGGAMIERGVHVHEWAPGVVSAKFGKKVSGRLLDGVEHNAFPEVRA